MSAEQSKPMSKGKTVRTKIGRDASSGEFVPVSYAQNHKRTTVVETIVRKQKSAK